MSGDNPPLRDDDISTSQAGSTGPRSGDTVDSTDALGSDADGTDVSDSGGDADGTDGGDADGTDLTDSAPGGDADGTDR